MHSLDKFKFLAYVITDGTGIKVGYTKDVEIRSKALRTANRNKLTTVNEFYFEEEQDARKAEAFLKFLLSKWPSEGGCDWYNPPSKVMDFLGFLNTDCLIALSIFESDASLVYLTSKVPWGVLEFSDVLKEYWRAFSPIAEWWE